MQLLGLDIGTTTICAVVLDAKLGTVIHSVTRPNDSQLASMSETAHEQDPNRIWSAIQQMVSEICRDFPSISGIGVSTQMHGILYVDKFGECVSPLYTWQDKSGDRLHPNGSTYTETLCAMTGYHVATGYGLVTNFYHICTDTLVQGAESLCTIGDFVAMKLTHQVKPVIDITNAASLGLFQGESFDLDALAKAGISRELLPPVVPCGTRIGSTASGVSVYAALGDNQASFLGAVPSPRTALLVNFGTGAQLSVWSESPSTIAGWEVRPFPGGGCLSVAASLGGGKSFALLERFFREVCYWFSGIDTVNLYSRLDELLTEDDAGEDPLLVRPQFFGSRLNPAERGSITNISGDNFTPRGLAHAWVRGMAEEFRAMFDCQSPEIRGKVTQFVGSGNGVRRNPALRKALEQSFQMPLWLSLYDEEAALGAAICAGVGEGVFSGFLEAGWILENHARGMS